jgi:hypothetical protein
MQTAGTKVRLKHLAAARCRSHGDRRRTQALEPGMSNSSKNHNLAARMAVWSSRHRKKAIWGWLAFVVVVFMAGNMIGTTQISAVDQVSGEAHKAEVALDRSGLRPNDEVVFVQSDKLTRRASMPGRRGGPGSRPSRPPARS